MRSPARHTRSTVLLALAVVLLSGGCADTSPEAQPSESTAPTPARSTPASPPATSPTPPTSPSPSDDGLAGEPIVGFFFSEGDTLAVVGVAHDDVLNVRTGPGVGADIIATLAPLADDVIAIGSARQLPRSIWVEVDTGDVTGWANASFLAYLGDTTDVTAEVMADLGADRTAATIQALGLAVAETRASTDPASDIVVVDGPTIGDLGEVTIDVIGLGDDSLYGLRLHVFGQPLETDAGFDLKSVEQTVLCGRGVSDDGRCV